MSSSAAGPAPSTPVKSGSSPLPPQFDAVTFVLHIDYFIFAVFVLFALFTIPRLVTRYSRKSEWPLGHIIRSGPSTGLKSIVLGTNDVVDSRFYNVSTADNGSTDSHTLYSHATLAQTKEKLRQVRPPRSRTCSSFFHPLTAALGHPITPGYSVGKLIIMLGYFMVILYATIYKSSPFSDPRRAGIVAMSQLPIVFALGTKNNVFGIMLSLGYEKVRSLSLYSTNLLTQLT